jgi:hypothetical protein
MLRYLLAELSFCGNKLLPPRECTAVFMTPCVIFRLLALRAVPYQQAEVIAKHVLRRDPAREEDEEDEEDTDRHAITRMFLRQFVC